MYRNIDVNKVLIDIDNVHIDLVRGTTPGAQFRSALAIGVTPDLGTSRTMFDDDSNYDSVDPHADIRTDWREYSNSFIDSVEGEPSQSPGSDGFDVPSSSPSSTSSSASSD